MTAAAIIDPAIWLLDVEQLADRLIAHDIASRIASPDEIAWTGRATAKRAAQQRLTTRIALRLLLAEAGAMHSLRMPLPLTPEGKPQLGEGEPAFSVSHSNDCALIALAPEGPIGIDLEHDRDVHMSEPRRAMMIAASDAVMTGLRTGLDENARLLAAWTCLEAIAKARGSGIGPVLTDLGITAAGARTGSPASAAAAACAILAESRLAVAALALPNGLYGAIARPTDALWPIADVRPLILTDVLALLGAVGLKPVADAG